MPEIVSVESNTPAPPPAPTDTATVVEVVLMVGVEAAVMEILPPGAEIVDLLT